VLVNVSAVGLWSLFVSDTGAIPVFTGEPRRDGSRTNKDFPPAELAQLQAETKQKMALGISGWEVRQSPEPDRVRFTIRELCEALERISSKEGELSYRERVLVDFLSAPDGKSFWATVKAKFKADPETVEQVKAAMWEDSMRAGMLMDGVELEQMKKNSVRFVHEVLVYDLEVSRSPTVVTVRASEECALRAGWLAAGLGSDVDRLHTLLSRMPERLRSSDSEAMRKRFDVPEKRWKVIPTDAWGRWTAGMKEATRLNIANGVRRLALPLFSADGPLQILRVRLETRPRVEAHGKTLRILPQRLSFSFATPGFRKYEGDGAEVSAGEAKVRSATRIEAAVASASRSVSSARVALRPLVGLFETCSSTRATVAFFVNTDTNVGAPIQALEQRVVAFSSVPAVPPFEVLDGRDKEDVELLRVEERNDAVAQIALADELVHRLVNKHAYGTGLVFPGAQTDARACADDVCATFETAMGLDREDLLFHCCSGGRGAWVLTRAAQEWERRVEQVGRYVAFADGATRPRLPRLGGLSRACALADPVQPSERTRLM
jgi:hypothetical protein